jgi:hypothetical protein
MDNHFHLLLETPQANLVTGMQWLMGTYGQGWNRAGIGGAMSFRAATNRCRSRGRTRTRIISGSWRTTSISIRRGRGVGNSWIAERLAMGHPCTVSRMLGACKSDLEIASIRNALAKELDLNRKGADK